MTRTQSMKFQLRLARRRLAKAEQDAAEAREIIDMLVTELTR